MIFIDHTGHTFEMQSYSEKPIGYEFETTPYIFWMNTEYSNKLSVNNYYTIPIRFALDKKVSEITINIDSEVYKLSKISNISNNLEISEDDLVSEISLSDISVLKNVMTDKSVKHSDFNEDFNEDFSGEPDGTMALYTFYIFGNTPEEGSWLTNVLIDITFVDNTKEWCPITIGGAFVNEIEQLQINARNIGVRLPKDILKAVYQESFYNDVFNEHLYNIKLKEYLMNHMILKGECGNYNSAISSLKWFGWGDHIELSKLLQTDNQFKDQFIHDYFDINDDLLESYKKFKNTTYIALTVYENTETGTTYSVDDTKALWGEGKPILEDLLNKTIEVSYDNTEVTFVRSYYDYAFSELASKLACLSYMYKKYFLPVHLSVHAATVEHKVFANDIKMLQVSSLSSTEKPILTCDRTKDFKSIVEFDNESIFYLYNRDDIYADDNYNRFTTYSKEYCGSSSNKYVYPQNQISTEIPIHFKTIKDDEVINGTYECVLLLKRNNELVYESHFSFSQDYQDYISFVIIPRIFGKKTNKEFWEDSTFTIDVLCNGTWYSKNFEIRIPDFDLRFGKLEYVYDYDTQKQIRYMENSYIDFNAVIWEPDIVTINDATFYDTIREAYRQGGIASFNTSFNDSFRIYKHYSCIFDYVNRSTDIIKIVDNDKYLNRIWVYDITYKEGGNDVRFIDTKSFSHSDTSTTFEFKDATMDLYRKFFTDNGELTFDFNTLFGNNFDYDFYLMHNNKKYYVVLISKDTIDKAPIKETLNDIIEFNGYVLKKFKSNDTFLINRMQYVSTEISENKKWFKNNFTSDDIIVSFIDNIDMPFNMTLGTKWEYSKRSIGGLDIEPVYSKTNMGIMSVPKESTQYVKGYYDVIVNYSIDEYHSHTRKTIGRILID